MVLWMMDRIIYSNNWPILWNFDEYVTKGIRNFLSDNSDIITSWYMIIISNNPINKYQMPLEKSILGAMK